MWLCFCLWSVAHSHTLPLEPDQPTSSSDTTAVNQHHISRPLPAYPIYEEHRTSANQ